MSLRWPLRIRRVEGESMTPTLRQGQIILAHGLYARLRPNDIVIFCHRGTEKIKRIKRIEGGQIELVGDNPVLSQDSRSFGLIDKKAVLGKLRRRSYKTLQL